jgi:hypothetical protein
MNPVMAAALQLLGLDKWCGGEGEEAFGAPDAVEGVAEGSSSGRGHGGH